MEKSFTHQLPGEYQLKPQYHHLPVRTVIIKKMKDKKCCKNTDRREPSDTAGMGSAILENRGAM